MQCLTRYRVAVLSLELEAADERAGLLIGSRSFDHDPRCRRACSVLTVAQLTEY
jgi:hypothetical protein